MAQLSNLVSPYLTEEPQLASSIYSQFCLDYPNVRLSLDEFKQETMEFHCPQVKGEDLYMKKKVGVIHLDTSDSDAAMLEAFRKNSRIDESNKIRP